MTRERRQKTTHKLLQYSPHTLSLAGDLLPWRRSVRLVGRRLLLGLVLGSDDGGGEDEGADEEDERREVGVPHGGVVGDLVGWMDCRWTSGCRFRIAAAF